MDRENELNDAGELSDAKALREDIGVLPPNSAESTRAAGKPNDDSPDRDGVRSKPAPAPEEQTRIAIVAYTNAVALALITLNAVFYSPE